MLLGTLDTKGHEYAFLRDRIEARGVEVLLVDVGILGEPLIEPTVSRQEVAEAAGADVEALADAPDRSAALDVMGRGATEIVLRLHTEGRCDAIGALWLSTRRTLKQLQTTISKGSDHACWNPAETTASWRTPS